MQYLISLVTYIRLWYERGLNYPLYWKLRLWVQIETNNRIMGGVKMLIISYLRHIETKKNSCFGIGRYGNCCKIKTPIRLYHGWNNIIIARNVEIGKSVEIFQNVTIAEADKTKITKIGDCASLGAGCIILNNASIGKYSKIGANAVVLNDVPPYSTAVGNPAKIIKK